MKKANATIRGSTFNTDFVEHSTIEEIRKERTVEGETGIRNKGRDDGRDGRGKAQLFICASDILFTDNTVDRKSSQGYIIKLFGGLIVWRVNKQDTVTTSSTEAKLLALS